VANFFGKNGYEISEASKLAEITRAKNIGDLLSKPRPDSKGKRLCQKIGKTEKYEDKHLLAG
jgi:hypothetical protein